MAIAIRTAMFRVLVSMPEACANNGSQFRQDMISEKFVSATKETTVLVND